MDIYNINRRDFITGSITLGTLGYCGLLNSKMLEKRNIIMAPERNGDKFSIGILDLDNDKIKHLPVPHFGHVLIPHPFERNLAVMAAQRPGKVSYLIDFISGKIIQKFNSVNGHHFYGHGLYMNNAKELWMTENSDTTGKGTIVIRDTKTFNIINTFDAMGFAPHEMKLLNNGKNLVIANGGNVALSKDIKVYKNDVIESSISYFDVKTKKQVQTSKSPFAPMSIRHLDVHLASNTVVMLLKQYPKNFGKIMPPLAFQQMGNKIDFFEAPNEVYQRINSMCLSVTINQETGIFAATSPISHNVTFWDIKKKKFLKLIEIKDAQGVCLAKDGQLWIITTTNGSIHIIDEKTLLPIDAYKNKYTGLNAFHVINSAYF